MVTIKVVYILKKKTQQPTNKQKYPHRIPRSPVDDEENTL